MFSMGQVKEIQFSSDTFFSQAAKSGSQVQIHFQSSHCPSESQEEWEHRNPLQHGFVSQQGSRWSPQGPLLQHFQYLARLSWRCFSWSSAFIAAIRFFWRWNLLLSLSSGELVTSTPRILDLTKHKRFTRSAKKVHFLSSFTFYRKFFLTLAVQYFVYMNKLSYILLTLVITGLGKCGRARGPSSDAITQYANCPNG